jgi:pimeloyl-ACP methyl ester carboxylesterase
MAWRPFAMALGLVGLLGGTSHAQTPFSADDLLKGTTVSAEACAKVPSAVFVTVDKRGTCIRYYLSSKLSGDRAVIYFPGDAIVRGPGGKPAPEPGYMTQSAEVIAIAANVWAERLKRPMIFFGRVGLHGSSGWHAHRRSQHEIKVTRAAIDAIVTRHGFTTLDVVGQSGGGLLAAALAASRADIGCAVMASTPLDFRAYADEVSWTFRNTGWLAHYDPIGEAGAVATNKGRVFVLTDPKDAVVPAATQSGFAPAVVAAGGRAVQVKTAGRGPKNHGLTEKALFLAGDCAAGKDDATIVKRFQGTGPEDFR